MSRLDMSGNIIICPFVQSAKTILLSKEEEEENIIIIIKMFNFFTPCQVQLLANHA